MLTVSIYRYHPELDAKPYMQDFQVDTEGRLNGVRRLEFVENSRARLGL